MHILYRPESGKQKVLEPMFVWTLLLALDQGMLAVNTATWLQNILYIYTYIGICISFILFGSCDCSNELSCSIKDGKFLDQLLKKTSALNILFQEHEFVFRLSIFMCVAQGKKHYLSKSPRMVSSSTRCFYKRSLLHHVLDVNNSDHKSFSLHTFTISWFQVLCLEVRMFIKQESD